MRISVYDLGPGKLELKGPCRWFVYAPKDGLSAEYRNSIIEIDEDSGVFLEEEAHLRITSAAWLYEIAPLHHPFLKDAQIQRSHPVRVDFAPPFILRADRIESPPGAATPRHGHRGPGMRRLVFGRLLAEIGDTVERLEEGDSWFETGKDMVVGTNLGPSNAAFVRVMLLPGELAGGLSSFMPENQIEASRPRAVTNRLFGEIRLDRPLQGDGE